MFGAIASAAGRKAFPAERKARMGYLADRLTHIFDDQRTQCFSAFALCSFIGGDRVDTLYSRQARRHPSSGRSRPLRPLASRLTSTFPT